MSFKYINELKEIVTQLNTLQGKAGKWAAVDRGLMAYIETAEGVRLAVHKQGNKWVFVETLYHLLGDNKIAKVADSKSSLQIAKDLQRRLLADGYEAHQLAQFAADREAERRYNERIEKEGGDTYIFEQLAHIVDSLRKADPLWGRYWLRDGVAIKRTNEDKYIKVTLTEGRHLVFKREGATDQDTAILAVDKGPELIAHELLQCNI